MKDSKGRAKAWVQRSRRRLAKGFHRRATHCRGSTRRKKKRRVGRGGYAGGFTGSQQVNPGYECDLLHRSESPCDDFCKAQGLWAAGSAASTAEIPGLR